MLSDSHHSHYSHFSLHHSHYSHHSHTFYHPHHMDQSRQLKLEVMPPWWYLLLVDQHKREELRSFNDLRHGKKNFPLYAKKMGNYLDKHVSYPVYNVHISWDLYIHHIMQISAQVYHRRTYIYIYMFGWNQSTLYHANITKHTYILIRGCRCWLGSPLRLKSQIGSGGVQIFPTQPTRKLTHTLMQIYLTSLQSSTWRR